ncbi:hypothetical protein LTR36_005309 [Oleoguttula mirabilis]|uniref:Alcohol acetyltransferase n=1 Tax=Oleoguttula mirabilis TaxID=1507867 RepID=A0AAV9JEK7_9PEZI|nr:hypothetical protein LTR36_005309 [Oleoguttula mirabilis]
MQDEVHPETDSNFIIGSRKWLHPATTQRHTSFSDVQVPFPSGRTALLSRSLSSPGKNEHRCIARHDLGYYGYVVVAGIYQAPTKLPSPLSTSYFFPALRHCFNILPILSAAVVGADTEYPQFVRPSHVNLQRHVRLVGRADAGSRDEQDVIKRAIIECHDRFAQHIDRVPPWDVTVIPLRPDPEADETRLCILFSYSHSHGDGTAGLPFHRTFLQGLQQHAATAQDFPANHDSVYEPPDRQLLPALEQVADLKISWSYLLGAIFSDRLPTFLRTALGLPSMTSVTDDTWLGSPISHDATTLRTGLEILVVKAVDIKAVISACRAHDARLTGLLHQLIVRALSQTLPKYTANVDSAPVAYDIVAQTPLNLSHLASGWASAADMVMAVSATQQLFPAASQQEPSNPAEEALWTGAKETGAKLAAAASTLTDQPIGLLRYVSEVRAWVVGQLGKARDCSYELSNIMMFDPEANSPQDTIGKEAEGKWEVGNMYFSQPANVVGPPLSFGVVSRKGGDLIVCLSWQCGVLDVSNEDVFAAEVLASLKSQVDSIVTGGNKC